MQNISLSNPVSAGNAPAASTSGPALGASSEPGASPIEGSFGATLTGVYQSSISPEKLDDIAAKLEALGLDSSFLDDINALLSGNLMSLDAAQQGIELPEMSTFLSNSLAELESGLGFSSDDIPEDVLASLLNTVNGIQQALAPVSANLPQALTGLDSGVAPVSVLPGVSFQNQDAKKSQVNLNTANQIQAAPLTNSNIDSGLGLSPQNLSQNGSAMLNLEEEVVSQALQGESKFKAIADSTSSVESILEKTIGSGVERSSSPLKTTFSEVQQKLDNAPYSTTVMTGLDEVEWGEEVGQKIVWLTGKAIQSAEIHLNPAELGPIDVKISVQNDAAAITFNAHNASVREMLESNVVRLREMMETNGVELQEVNVDARSGDERFASNDQQQGSNGSEDQQEDSEDSSSETATTESISRSSSNLVDYFA
ncbi:MULTISPECIES: flagellar hook-length control protein FliK [unclassified Oleiphilus]|uniref:flagellar hook-length control protein FliK n=1 Tax=unclassified Oleiphilus TaxID=2631174 RepID=UPI0007C36F81|nr:MULTISPECIES: flagellar hook-length control protein FliK [unclassified Oleiphilus]KZY47160.1 hypothetical protein A3732_06940 [Oleiphilus sp. HI0050]KZZ34016.1 hypothetical protein A3756_03605 [Oleiphilus sp. HI0086]KZZ36312.1 hypothetical protein A3757_13945 [Oleiphilus sp. HI0117]KZZ53342.1 hypothetical protein A3761_02575 [Oleiphilus sp. HI0123]